MFFPTDADVEMVWVMAGPAETTPVSEGREGQDVLAVADGETGSLQQKSLLLYLYYCVYTLTVAK